MTYQPREHELIASHAAQDYSELPIIPARWLALALAASAVVIVALMIHNRLMVDTANWAFGALVTAIAVFSLIRHRTHGGATQWKARWRDFSESALLMLLIGTLGAIGSYEAATDTTGFYDAALERADQMLHFNWLSLYLLVVEHPLLQRLGAAAYGSVFITPWILLGWLAWHGQRAQARQFLMTFWLASVLTLVIFPLIPARGALEFLWHGPIRYMPTNGLYQGEIIPALRDHAITRIDLSSVRGLVCAPSFHTVCAIVYIVSAWPIAALRRFLVPLNAAMLLATPVEGTHYLSDMLLGAMVAVTAIMLTRIGATLSASEPILATVNRRAFDRANRQAS